MPALPRLRMGGQQSDVESGWDGGGAGVAANLPETPLEYLLSPAFQQDMLEAAWRRLANLPNDPEALLQLIISDVAGIRSACSRGAAGDACQLRPMRAGFLQDGALAASRAAAEAVVDQSGRCEWARGTPLPTLFCNSQNIQRALDLAPPVPGAVPTGGNGESSLPAGNVPPPVSGPGSASDCEYTQAYTCTYYERVHSFPPGFTYADCVRNYANVTSREPAPPVVTGVGAGNASICVSWEPPADTGNNCLNHSSPLVGYTVTLSFNQSNPSAPIDFGAPAADFSQLAVAAQRMVRSGVESTIFSGLANGVVYLADVQAIASTGLMSELGGGFSRAAEVPLANATGCYRGPAVGWRVTAAIAVGVALGTVVFLLGIAVVMRRRFDRYEIARRSQAEKLHLVATLQGISGGLGQEADGKWLFEDVVGRVDDNGWSDRPVAFVFTDVQGSTAMAERDSLAFSEMQMMHDEILRSHIVAFDGYEVDTEGDAFRIAFPDFRSATGFCFAVQEELMWFPWPAHISRLPGAGPMHAEPSGELLLAGPRVRMGIHVAAPREYKATVHPLTKRIVFTGPGYSQAKAVGDAAWGGQILVSGASLLGADRSGSAESAGYPVFEDLGLWVAPGKPDKGALRLFQVSPTFWVSASEKMREYVDAVAQKGRLSACVTCLSWSTSAAIDTLFCRTPRGAGTLPLMWPHREFPTPRRMEMLAPGLGRHWFCRPAELTFVVSVHVDLRSHSAGLREGVVGSLGPTSPRGAKAPPALGSSGLWIFSPPPRGGGSITGPPARSGRPHPRPAWRVAFEGTVAHLLNMFQGCELEVEQGRCAPGNRGHELIQYIFRTPAAALRFALSLQVALLVAHWPPDVLDLPACRTERSHDGHLLYRGPRAAIGVHTSRALALKVGDRKAGATHAAAAMPVLRWGSAGSGSASPVSRALSPRAAMSPAAAPLKPPASPRKKERVPAKVEAAKHTLKVVAQSGGEDLEIGAAISLSAHPGQVIVSEDAWATINSAGSITVPGTPRVIHLGCHSLDCGFSGPREMQLVELTPRQLAARAWPPPRTLEQHTAGCREAPGFRSCGLGHVLQPAAPIAVLFTFPVAPAGEMSQLPAYAEALDSLSFGMKALLRQHRGYFCQMVDPGCLMAAFSGLRDALEYAGHLQTTLCSLEPPGGLPPASELYPDEGGIFRNRNRAKEFSALLGPLRLGIGIAFGPASSVKAHPVTGRADYFGSVVNLAARLASAAHGGQILFEGSPAALLHAEDATSLVFHPLGRYKFKGITKHHGVAVVQAVSRDLEFMEREYPDLTQNAVPAVPGIPLESVSFSNAPPGALASFGPDEWIKRSDSQDNSALKPVQSFRL